MSQESRVQTVQTIEEGAIADQVPFAGQRSLQRQRRAKSGPLAGADGQLFATGHDPKLALLHGDLGLSVVDLHGVLAWFVDLHEAMGGEHDVVDERPIFIIGDQQRAGGRW